jgi:hypothetical protein
MSPNWLKYYLHTTRRDIRGVVNGGLWAGLGTDFIKGILFGGYTKEILGIYCLRIYLALRKNIYL